MQKTEVCAAHKAMSAILQASAETRRMASGHDSDRMLFDTIFRTREKRRYSKNTTSISTSMENAMFITPTNISLALSTGLSIDPGIT